MAARQAWQVEQRPFIKRVAGLFFLIFVMFYLSFHAVSGEHGALALLRESRKLELLNSRLEEIKAERKAVEHKARLLSDGSLDLDLLDEQARRVLGMAGRDEIVHFEE